MKLAYVDRPVPDILSPPAREVWIEIGIIETCLGFCQRHLPRGRCGLKLCALAVHVHHQSHLPRGRCGLKSGGIYLYSAYSMSPPAREVWIEISPGRFSSSEPKVTSREGGVD